MTVQEGVYGFIAAGRTYLVPHALEDDGDFSRFSTVGATYISLLTRIRGQGNTKHWWLGDVLNNVRRKYFLSDLDAHANTEDAAHQPLPSEMHVRQCLGSALAPKKKNWLHRKYSGRQRLEYDPTNMERSARETTAATRPACLLAELTQEVTYGFLDGPYSSCCWSELQRVPLLRLTSTDYPTQGDRVVSTAFVVDLDNDTVAALERLPISAPDGGWEVVSCARLSSSQQLGDMNNDLGWWQERIFSGTSEPLWTRLTTQALASNLSRFNELGGSTMRNFLHSPCAANLRRPPGFPLLVDQTRYPVDDVPDLLEAPYRRNRHLGSLPLDGDSQGETDMERLTRKAFETHDLDTLTSEQLSVAARRSDQKHFHVSKHNTITPQMYKMILKLKTTRDFTNERIGRIVGVPKDIIGGLTAGMPRAKPKRKRLPGLW